MTYSPGSLDPDHHLQPHCPITHHRLMKGKGTEEWVSQRAEVICCGDLLGKENSAGFSKRLQMNRQWTHRTAGFSAKMKTWGPFCSETENSSRWQMLAGCKTKCRALLNGRHGAL